MSTKTSSMFRVVVGAGSAGDALVNSKKTRSAETTTARYALGRCATLAVGTLRHRNPSPRRTMASGSQGCPTAEPAQSSTRRTPRKCGPSAGVAGPPSVLAPQSRDAPWLAPPRPAGRHWSKPPVGAAPCCRRGPEAEGPLVRETRTFNTEMLEAAQGSGKCWPSGTRGAAAEDGAMHGMIDSYPRPQSGRRSPSSSTATKRRQSPKPPQRVGLGVGVVHVSCVEAGAKRHRDEHDRHHQPVHQEGQVAHGHDTEPTNVSKMIARIGIVALISQVARLGIPR